MILKKSLLATWLGSSISTKQVTKDNATSLQVSSPQYATDVRETLKPSGVFYCKLYPPSLDVEWILLDSLLVN